jgi:hypothetical protein
MADETTAPAAPAPVEGVAGSAADQVDALAAEAAAESETIEVRGQTFRVASEIPAIVMLRMTAAGDAKTPPAKQMKAIVDFLHYVVHSDDRERFDDLLEDADPVIGFDELNSIVEATTEVIAARPTEQS